MATLSATSLVDALRQHRLLEPDQLEQVAKQIKGRKVEPRVLAQKLIEHGWLTPYQVNQLFLGRGQDIVLGGYVMLERLGEGGMGVVFKARHRNLGRIVALKLVRKERLANANSVKRFHREIQLAAQLNHPNIVLAFDADQIGDSHFFTMEYVDGVDLSHLVKQSGPLPVARACDYVRQAALGLQHALERGLVHRDIKPSNLLLSSKDGAIKVLDMGLARFQGAMGDSEAGQTLTQENAVVGTPDYMAPEQILDARSADIRADLYSLGCTLYFLLTGRAPFPGGSLGEKLLKHQLHEPEPVDKVRPDVPPDVAGVIRKLLAKRPEDRYQTPAELAAALSAGQRRAPAAAGGMPPPSGRTTGVPADTLPGVGATRPLWRAARQRPRLLSMALVGACLLVLMVFLMVAFHLGNPPADSSAKATPVATKQLPALRELVWIDDDVPPGAKLQGDTPWEWVSAPDPVHSGKKSMRRSGKGITQHFFNEATPGLKISPGDKLFAHVYIDPKDPPKAVMLQFNDSAEPGAIEAWDHRAFWGEDAITYGTSGGPSRLAMGPLPKAGEWVRLEVDAALVGLKSGSVINGWAFTQHSGTVWWDKAGLVSTSEGETPTPRKSELVNSLKMRLALIPAGDFVMGSPETELERKPNEGPQHAVTISRPFYMGVHEVTVGEFQAFVQATGYQTDGEREGTGAFCYSAAGETVMDPKCNWRNPGFPQTDAHPVSCVSRGDAVAFCQWLSKKEGKSYRLPSEAEWEYACRARSTTAYHCGNTLTAAQAHFNVTTTPEKPAQVRSVKVGSFPPNAFGLHDMHGNVWEWTADTYDQAYYGRSPRQDPPGPPPGADGVFRGGGFEVGAASCRSAFRFPTTASFRHVVIGFRVVCDP